MTLTLFRQTWHRLVTENHFHRWMLLALLGTNLLTLVALLQAERTVILVPPILEQQVNVARESASQSVKEAWGLFVAELLGNATPTTAPFLRDTLEPLLSPAIRAEVTRRLAAQVEALRRDQVSVRFSPEIVRYDATGDLVRVQGKQIVSGPNASPVTRARTYEIRVAFRHYRPLITHLDAYENEKAREERQTPTELSLLEPLPEPLPEPLSE
ncbi:conjugal transfer protein TraE [Thiocystis minor]|jgi:conjugal transfer pilus assembly protein TraE|uniref:TraE/TraK family type IV conjugative transfer system protein n=1 Tax=Thiocystis minor TaxID=61597 RepID=UPI0019142FC3|nr:TraE/TraK family type IV conjugative transfer system protein [Thiocystis minor]MBK5966436.1 conjugal transfer protein TraE [Thiocystis minor]